MSHSPRRLGALILDETARAAGKAVMVDATNTKLEYGAGGGGTSDHGALTGLTDADHPVGAIAFTATDVLCGRSTAGAGAGEEVACSAAGRAILDDANAAAQRTTLGLGAAATKTGWQGVVHLATAQVGTNWYQGQGLTNTSYADGTTNQSMWFSLDADLLNTCLGSTNWTIWIRVCLGATTDARTVSFNIQNETDTEDMGTVTQAAVNTNPSYSALPAYALQFQGGTLPAAGCKRVRARWKTDGGTYIIGSGVNIEARATA